MANIKHNIKNLLLRGKTFVSVIKPSEQNLLAGKLDKNGLQSVSGGAVDDPAGTFLSAAGITDPTITTATYQLVAGLQADGLWSKMKAIYPMVGGNATAHSYNLKDTTKFQITWNGGWTHSSTGSLPNGTNAYAETLNPNVSLTTPSHLSKYTSTNANRGTDEIDMGVASFWLSAWYNGSGYNSILARNQSNSVLLNGGTVTDSRGFVLTTKIGTTAKIFKNNVQKDSKTDTETTYANYGIYLGAGNFSGPNYYSVRNFSFASIGDGLSDTEASNLYTRIQTFQTSLNRYVGTPIVSDSDAQSFLNTASITDLTQANAINTLVTDLKSANLWTKMKAVYPMVGGTASSHSYNLKNPAQFQITWSGGITHDSNGITGNGTNGYGNTGLIPGSSLTNNSLNISTYSRSSIGSDTTEMGCSESGYLPIIGLTIRSTSNNAQFDGYDFSNHRIMASETDGRGLFIGSITSSTSQKLYKNTTIKATSIFVQGLSQPSTRPLYILARNDSGTAANYSPKNIAFSTIGDGLTDTDASNLYTIVQNYQTSLSRQV